MPLEQCPAPADPSPAPAGGQTLSLPATNCRLWLPLAVLALGLLVLWFDLGGSPLFARSEGRYASVSMTMADGGNWLIPHFRGQVHLTKPPLTYWLEALCLRAWGHQEWAVRLPSAVAGSLTLILLLSLAWRIGGIRVASLATGLLAIMPLHLVLNRLTLTDSLLSLFWLATLASSYLAVKNPHQRRWPVLLGLSLALALFTKGPVGLVPLAVVILWLLIAGRGREIHALRLHYVLTLASLPLLAWVLAAARENPTAWQVWQREVGNRLQGGGDHQEPFWYFIPVFIAGLFPATAMLNLPGLNYSWRSLLAALRRGDDSCLFALAVLVPLLLFSLMEGKLVSYLLPLAAPQALLTALMLERWLSGQYDRPAAGIRPPDVVVTLYFVFLTALTAAGAYLAIAQRELWRQLLSGYAIWLLPLLVLGPAGWLWWTWCRRPQRRGVALLTIWLLMIALWLAAFGALRTLRQPASYRTILAQIRQLEGLSEPELITFGFTDTALGFYYLQEVEHLEKMDELAAAAQRNPQRLAVLVEPEGWAIVQQNRPEIAALFVEVLHFDRGPLDRRRLLVRPAGALPAASPAAAPAR